MINLQSVSHAHWGWGEMIQIPQVSTLEASQIAISDGAKMLLTTKEWARRVPKVMTLSSLLALFFTISETAHMDNDWTDCNLVCCIYHKPRPVGESSSESESSDSDSDSDSDSEADRHQNRPNRSQHHLGHRESSHHRHSSQEDSEKGHTACCTKHHDKQGKRRKPSPNAYERMPKPPKGHHKSQGA